MARVIVSIMMKHTTEDQHVSYSLFLSGGEDLPVLVLYKKLWGLAVD